MHWRTAWIGALGISLALGGHPANSAPAGDERGTLTVFAAASLTDALTETGEAYRRRTGVVVRHSFASSAQIARQIDSGARADVFIAADVEWMDYLAERRLIDVASRRNIAGNQLAIISARPLPQRFDPSAADAWRRALGTSRLATGDPDSVPLGRYAREALQRLLVWQTVEPRIARAENARAALALVARGEAPLGIVYLSDARSEPRVRVVTVLPKTLHRAILYPAAATATASADARAYLDFLTGPDAQAIFAKRGFTSAR